MPTPSRKWRPSPEHVVWVNMRQRCHNPRVPDYEHYGAKGIRVCERWSSFNAFVADMGPRPPGMTLDRIKSDGDYEPGNCRWATRAEQTRNRRVSALEPHEPEQIRWLHSLGYRQVDIARFFGVSKSVVNNVIRGRSWIPLITPLQVGIGSGHDYAAAK